MDGSMVIVGGGLAAAKTAEALRNRGFDGAIVMIAGEKHLPYERPPLSKGFLSGSTVAAKLLPLDADWYAVHHVDLRTGVRATKIDRADHLVFLDDGSAVRYDKLVLATGSRPRAFPGEPAVAYLRSVDDAQALRERLGDGRSLVIVGGGWIGLEVAATARSAGTAVTVVEPQRLPLLGILGERVAGIVAGLHRRHGVDLRLDTGVDGIEVDEVTGGPGGRVTTTDGATLEADTILVGIGALPNTEIAAAAGLPLESGGVVVDAELATFDPDVYAVGDIANYPDPHFGRLRVEHWANALNQPAVAAANLLGHHETYDRLPYFFTDQYEFGMEYRGYATGENRVAIRGNTDALEFLAFWLDGENRVCAGMNVNLWDDSQAIADLITSKRIVDPDRLADRSIALAEV
ncbi:MAG: FAD-dependent oxidoreductase [Gordonia sp. (in: high G+C Gram-positive bacteria)]|uniref:NAD(P)/FAD-dependent oxidoreductase n=1 Tax=Gordonia sp. (in: high G+C Gram-positive bacteria) TaxID=84139 RepID=UPI003BB5ACF5